MNYQLRDELQPAHLQDVKAVLSIDQDTIASASRDGSVAVWRQKENRFELQALLAGHDAYVNSLAHIPASKDGPSGGNSTLILLHSLDSLRPEAVHALIGHALNVCTLAYASTTGCLLSGSWDCTARVWKLAGNDWQPHLVLDAHIQAVWGVAVVEHGNYSASYLTASADQLVILWDTDGNVLGRFKGHSEPIRGLAVLPDGEKFATACNDGLLRIFDFTGSCLAILQGHKDSVFSLKNPEGTDRLVSAGEDHSARLWEGSTGQTLAKLLHPCQTVWSADVLPNGDIITGGSDGKVRIWSAESKRWAGEDLREAYLAEVSSATANPGSLPSASSSITVDVDVSDDAEPLRLTMNANDDVQAVATSFIAEHNLPESYLGQIIDFINLHVQNERT